MRAYLDSQSHDKTLPKVEIRRSITVEISACMSRGLKRDHGVYALHAFVCRRVRELLDLVRDKQKIMLESSEESVVPYVLDFHRNVSGFMALAHHYNLAETCQKQKIWYD